MGHIGFVCPHCGETEMKILGTVTTLLQFQEFYVPGEGWHYHNPNEIRTEYECVNGHRWYRYSKEKCKSCGFNGDEPVKIEGINFKE